MDTNLLEEKSKIEAQLKERHAHIQATEYVINKAKNDLKELRKAKVVSLIEYRAAKDLGSPEHEVTLNILKEEFEELKQQYLIVISKIKNS